MKNAAAKRRAIRCTVNIYYDTRTLKPVVHCGSSNMRNCAKQKTHGTFGPHFVGKEYVWPQVLSHRAEVLFIRATQTSQGYNQQAHRVTILATRVLKPELRTGRRHTSVLS